MFNNQIIAGSSGQGGSFYPYSIDQSLRFNDADNHYLNRVASTGDSQKWTWSGWVKRGNLGTLQAIFSEGTTGSSFALYFNSTDTLLVQERNSSSNRFVHNTSAVFRDVGAWMHICYAVDTTQATDSNRVNIYVNGEIQTLVAVGSNNIYPSLNLSTNVNVSGRNNLIGYAATNANNCLDGYLAEVHFVDGQQLNATDFAEEINGVWVPKQVSGMTYGTNGYYLTFSSDSFTDNASDPDSFADQAGSNNYDAYKFTASDIVSDSPTNSFCTLNPLTHGTYPTLKEGNLSIASVYSADLSGVASTWYPTTGKWYWEVHNENAASTYPYLGITDQRYTNWNATQGSYYGVAWLRTGTSASSTNYMGTITKNNVTSWTNNDIIMFALDVDARKLWVGKNGTWDGSGDPAAGTGEDASWTDDTGVSPMLMGYSGQGVDCVFNFGQDGTFAGNQTAQGNADENGVGDFYYSPPSGFLAMATSNIDDGAIGPNSTTTSDQNFNTVLYTGTGATQSITGVGFQPDWTWIKARSAARSNVLYDSVRGVTKQLISNLTNAESTASTSLTSFDSDGFSIGTSGAINTSSDTLVAWNWKAGGTAVSNTDGSITSSVSANPDAGFAVGTYTGNATAGATIGHSLGEIPEMVIVKRRTNARDWSVYHKDQSATPTNAYLLLNSTAGVATGNTAWNNGTFTSSVFTIGSHELVNFSGDSYVFYAFKGIEGFSKVAKFYGNGNSNGPFVFTGFRPAFVLLKVSSAANNWFIYDNKREGYNQENDTLSPNLTAVEDNSYKLDLVSNGFKIRGSNNAHNQSGQTFIYLAFAEAPFKYANAR